MCKKYFSALVSAFLCIVLLLSCSVSVAALDDKYTIDELKMSIKVPKEYIVITRDTEREDESFASLSLDYDETMTAFSTANIYMQALSDDAVLKVTLTSISDDNSKAINNYSDLSATERKQVLDAFMQNSSYTSGKELKRNGTIYFDMALTQQTEESTIYCYQCHTVVNGLNINLTLQKGEEELTADEIKVVTNMANTINFDKIKRSSGPSFEWWRFLLWIVILVVIGLLAKYFYAQYNNNKKEKSKRPLRVSTDDSSSEEDGLLLGRTRYKSEDESMHELLSDFDFDHNENLAEEEISFDELLGYDTTDYHQRANSELDSFDIKVKSKDEKIGVSYFEDSGKSINDKKDYFDEFFSQETERRPAHKRFFSTVALYVRMILRRISYFFKNLTNMGHSKSSKRRKK